MQSAILALRRRVLRNPGQGFAEQRRLTHELSDISNTATASADQEASDDPLAVVALLSVAGKPTVKTELLSQLGSSHCSSHCSQAIWFVEAIRVLTDM